MKNKFTILLFCLFSIQLMGQVGFTPSRGVDDGITCDTCVTKLLECPSSVYLDNQGECIEYTVSDTTIQVYGQQLIYQDCDTSYVQSIQYTDAAGNPVTTDSCTIETSITIDSSSCRWELDLVSLTDTSKKTINLYVNDNDLIVSKVARFIVTNCNGIVIESIQNSGTLVRTGVRTVDPFVEGAYIDSLRVESNETGLEIFDIPLSPTSATLSGCAGDITASQLSYSAANPADFRAALEIAIQNYLCTLGFVVDDHYRLSTSGTDFVSFRFSARHNPTGKWLGIDKDSKRIVYYHDPSSPANSNTISANSSSGGPFRFAYETGCGIIQLTTSAIIPSSINFNETTWDSIVISSPTATYTDNTNLTTRSINCNRRELVAETNCVNNPTITWDTGFVGPSIDDDGNTHTFDVDNCECSMLTPCESENEENNTTTLDYLICVGDSISYRVVETIENGMVTDRKTFGENGAIVPYPDFFDQGQCMSMSDVSGNTDQCEGLGRWGSKTISDGENYSVAMADVWSVTYTIVEGSARVTNAFFDLDGSIGITVDTLSAGFSATKSTGDECRYFDSGSISLSGLDNAKIKIEYLW